MSEENVELVKATYAAYDSGDLAAVVADLHPDVVACAHPIGERYEGREGFLRFIANWTDQFEEFQQIPEEFMDAGDRVIVRIHQKGRGKGSGVPVEARFWLVHLLDDGKNRRVDLFDNEADAFEAAGLSE
jgi:ketosteroid isomerase-like protein